MTTKHMNVLSTGFTPLSNNEVLQPFTPSPILLTESEEAPDIQLQKYKDAYNPAFPKNLLYEKITKIFMTIGIPANVKGYHFLREAIQLTLNEFNMINCVMKKLYPMVASRFNTNPYIVERCIRNAIEIACNRGKMINLNKLFGIVILERNDKPTNSELIALLVEKLYLENNQTSRIWLSD